jgi:hypothetical protein
MQSGTLWAAVLAASRAILGRSEASQETICERSARGERMNSGREAAPPPGVRTGTAQSRARMG